MIRVQYYTLQVLSFSANQSELLGILLGIDLFMYSCSHPQIFLSRESNTLRSAVSTTNDTTPGVQLTLFSIIKLSSRAVPSAGVLIE